MDATAIQLIQQTAIDAGSARHIALVNDPLIALPNDYSIHDLEKFQPKRRRFRGRLATDSLADFVAYVKRRTATGDATPGFIEAAKLAATVYFNLGSVSAPGHCDDTAMLALKTSAPYAALLQVNGRQLAHKESLDWLEDWAAEIRFLDADLGELPFAAGIAALRKITIRATAEKTSSQDNFRATRSALEDVEARGAADLPAFVRFTCTPYAGLPDMEFILRVGVLTSTDKPVITLRVRNLEAAQELIAQDFKRVLLQELEGAATMTIGTFTP